METQPTHHMHVLGTEKVVFLKKKATMVLMLLTTLDEILEARICAISSNYPFPCPNLVCKQARLSIP